MLMVVSPAKSLNFEDQVPVTEHGQPLLLNASQKLAKGMQSFSAKELTKLMEISDKLATLNVERFKQFKTPFDLSNAKQAVYAFQGDTYQGLAANKWGQSEIAYAQKNLRLLSGLYGVLAPLDLIQPYRLEMGTKFGTKTPIKGIKDLYQFWGDDITKALNAQIKKQKARALVNLASQEYFSAVNEELLSVPVITPIFKDKSGSGHKVIGLFAKRARGMMSDFMIRNQIKSADELSAFNQAGYRYSAKDSKANMPVFLRDKVPPAKAK